LKQMGHDVSVLQDGVKSQVNLPVSYIDPKFNSSKISIAQLSEIIRNNTATIVDIRGSMQYRKAHLPNSLWAVRPRLQEMIRDAKEKIVIISDDQALTYGALLELDELNLNVQVYELEGSEFPQEFETISTQNIPPDHDCIDFLFFVHDRHDGNKDAARRYLEWETGLISQLDHDELNLYSIQ